jgi:hypothetical protein
MPSPSEQWYLENTGVPGLGIIASPQTMTTLLYDDPGSHREILVDPKAAQLNTATHFTDHNQFPAQLKANRANPQSPPNAQLTSGS